MAELIEFHKVPLYSADDHFVDKRYEETGLVPPLAALMPKPHELEQIFRSRITVKPIVKIKRPRNCLNPGQQSVPSSALNAAPPTAVESPGQAVLPDLQGVVEPPKTSIELESVVEPSTNCESEGIPVQPNLCEDLEGIASLCDDLEGIAEVAPPTPNPNLTLHAQSPRPTPFCMKATARKSTKMTASVGKNNTNNEVKPCSVRLVDLKEKRPKRLKKLLRQYYAYTSKNIKSCHKPTPKDCSEIKLVIKKVSRNNSSDSGHITDELDEPAPPPPSVQDVLRKISVNGTHPHPPHLANGSSSKPGTGSGSPGTVTLYASFVPQSDANPPQKRSRTGKERSGWSEAENTPDKKVKGSDDPQSLSPPAKKKAKCESYLSAVSPPKNEPDSTPPQNVCHSRKRIVFSELQETAPNPLRQESQTVPRPLKKEDEPPPAARKRIKPIHVHPDFLKRITTRGGYLSTFSDRTGLSAFSDRTGLSAFSDKVVALPTDVIFTCDLDCKLKKTHQVQVVSSKIQKEVFLQRIEPYPAICIQCNVTFSSKTELASHSLASNHSSAFNY